MPRRAKAGPSKPGVTQGCHSSGEGNSARRTPTIGGISTASPEPVASRTSQAPLCH